MDAGRQGSCPHLDRNDVRCGSRLTITRLDEAFGLCMADFRRCPVFHRLTREAVRVGAADPLGSFAPHSSTRREDRYVTITCQGLAPALDAGAA